MPLSGRQFTPARRPDGYVSPIVLGLLALSLWTGHARASKCYSYFYPKLVVHSDGAQIEGGTLDTSDSATPSGAPVWRSEAGFRLSQGTNRWIFSATAGSGDVMTLLSPEPE